MPKETRLLPCPFCGYDVVEVISFEVEATQSIEFAVTCQNCSCFGPNDISPRRAEEMWNLRRDVYPTDLALVVRLIEGAMPGLSYYATLHGMRTPAEWAQWEETFRVLPRDRERDPAQMILTFDDNGSPT